MTLTQVPAPAGMRVAAAVVPVASAAVAAAAGVVDEAAAVALREGEEQKDVLHDSSVSQAERRLSVLLRSLAAPVSIPSHHHAASGLEAGAYS